MFRKKKIILNLTERSEIDLKMNASFTCMNKNKFNGNNDIKKIKLFCCF